MSNTNLHIRLCTERFVHSKPIAEIKIKGGHLLLNVLGCRKKSILEPVVSEQITDLGNKFGRVIAIHDSMEDFLELAERTDLEMMHQGYKLVPYVLGEENYFTV